LSFLPFLTGRITEATNHDEQTSEHFAFLDALRVSGMTCNRFGAAEHLVLAFGLDPTDARRVHAAWMQARASR
jgi:hypothetical protein